MNAGTESTDSRSSLHWFMLVSSLFALTGAGAWLGAVRITRAAAALQIDAAALDFGEQWAKPGFELTVPVQNLSSTPIDVKRVRVSCTCLNVTPKSFVVPPQGNVKLTFMLDLTANARSDSDEAPYDEEFVLMSDTESLPVSQAFRLKGAVKRPLLLSPENRQLSPSPSGAAEWSVPIIATLPLKDIVARTDAEHAWVAAFPSATKSNQWRLEIQCTAKSRGHFEIPVVLQPEAADGTTRLPEVRWTFRGSMVSPVQVLPEDADFGIVARNVIARERLTLRRSDGRPCRVSELRPPAGITATLVETDDPNVVRIDVEAAFKTVGLQQTAIEVAIGGTEAELETLTIPVRAYVKSTAPSAADAIAPAAQP